MGIIAKPKVGVINVPYNTAINKDCNTYASYYQKGIVENKKRNAAIVREVVTCVSMSLPVLVLVEKLKHGRILKGLLKRRKGLNVPFIQGKMGVDQRRNLKHALIEEKIHAAIATRVWTEGVNIPNLRAIIYAAGMKEERKALQAMGRGLRTTAEKDTIMLIDFLDPYRYLAEHSIARLQVYNQEKWL